MTTGSETDRLLGSLLGATSQATTDRLAQQRAATAATVEEEVFENYYIISKKVKISKAAVAEVSLFDSFGTLVASKVIPTQDEIQFEIISGVDANDKDANKINAMNESQNNAVTLAQRPLLIDVESMF